MNRDEFTALPPSVALGLLWDVAKLEERLRGTEAPKLPRPPKFDSAIYRKDGVQWASETDLSGLRFWRDKKLSSSNPEYAEKDAKAAKALDYWIQWRLVEPFTPWTGERNRVTVTAQAPRGKPEVYPRDGGARRRDPEPSAPYNGAPNFDEDGGGDEEFPF